MGEFLVILAIIVIGALVLPYWAEHAVRTHRGDGVGNALHELFHPGARDARVVIEQRMAEPVDEADGEDKNPGHHRG